MSAQTASDVQGFLPSVRWWFGIRWFKTWVGARVWTLWSSKERLGGKEPTRCENLYSSQIVLFVVSSSERLTVWRGYLKKYCFSVPFFKFKIDVINILGVFFFSSCVDSCTSVTVHWGSVTEFWFLKFWSPGPKILLENAVCLLKDLWYLLGQGESRLASHVLHVTTTYKWLCGIYGHWTSPQTRSFFCWGAFPVP